MSADNPTYGLDDVAVYPTALSSEHIDAHWNARLKTPPGSSAIAGSAVTGNGSGAVGARMQACPASGGACAVDPYPVDPSGAFHVVVPDGRYTVTIFPPPGSQSAAQTIGPLSLPPSALDLRAVLSPTDGLPPGVTITTPPGGPSQQNVVGNVNWNTPSTVTASGCRGGYGFLTIMLSNASTGLPQTRTFPFVEAPPGSGTYEAHVPPLAPMHGPAQVRQAIACPDHTRITPDGGPPEGGTRVLMEGSGFTGATAVRFGDSPAASFHVLTDEVITAVSPPGTGTVPVTVTTPGGATLSVGAFTYLAVTGVDPAQGPASGGTTVTIHGQGFTNVKNVRFGIEPAQSFTVVSPTRITAVSPPGLGTVDIQVINGSAASAAVAADYFTYTGGPPGSSDLVEGTGLSAPQQYASSLVSYCSATYLGTFTTSCADAETWDSRLSAVAEHVAFDALGDTIMVIAAELIPDIDVAKAVLAFLLPDFVPEWLALVLVEEVPVAIAVFVGAEVLENVFEKVWDLFIDPSGTVVDTAGSPIGGATATLLTRPPGGGPFSPVDPSSGAIVPGTNPQTTGDTGAFEWDALSGTYEVEASAPGCHAPGDASARDVFTSPFALPPPAVGLLLTLDCPGSAALVPKVTRVDPAGGYTAGGTIIDITGTGLAGVTNVRFGSHPATQVRVLSPYAVAAVAPAGTGTVDVTVTSPGGTSTVSDEDRYTYITPSPTPDGPAITGVTPASGPLSGGTPVTIRGDHLDGAFAVDFGGTPASQVTAVSSDTVRATSPAAQFPAHVDVSVTTPAGTSIPVPADGFTYGSPPPLPVPAVHVTATPSEASAGQRLTLTATTSPMDGGGTFAFYADGSPAPFASCGALPLVRAGDAYGADCSAFGLPPGDHTITARYSGDASYAASAGTTAVRIVAPPTGTPTPSPGPAPPVATAPPAIAGAATVGHRLTASPGEWSGATPMTFVYQWQRCAARCHAIARASRRAYTLGRADLGAKVFVTVTATNGAGSATADSARVGPVGPDPRRVRALLATVARPRGGAARIGSLLHRGGYQFRFAAPSAGRLEIAWYSVPRRSRSRVPLARLRAEFRRARSARVDVALLRAGRRLLAGANGLTLTARASFAPVGAAPDVFRTQFSLRR